MMAALTIWRVALVSLCLPTLLISAGPEGWNPDPEGATACTDENNQMYKQTYYIFNKDGVPRPSDLRVAELYGGVPHDLTSLALMRALVENNPEDIKALLPFNNTDVRNDRWKAPCIENRSDTSMPLVDFMGPPSGFWAYNITTAYDSEVGSLWPVIIQNALEGKITGGLRPGSGGLLAGIKHQFGRNCFVACLSHPLDVATYAAPMANLFWNDGLHRPGKFVTEPIPRRENGTINYPEIDKFINRTTSSLGPTLLITKNETTGVINPGTVYTLSMPPPVYASDNITLMPQGSLVARDVRLQPKGPDHPGNPGQEVRISAQEIAMDGAFLTHLEW